jgi:hypothetical protein
MPEKPDAKTAEPPIFTHKLEKPVRAYDEELTELSFRKPLGIDILNIGNPVNLDLASDPPSLKFDTRVMTHMLSRLGAVPLSTSRNWKLKTGSPALGDLKFFSAKAGDDLINACIDLGLVYKTDPLKYMRLPEHVVAELYRRTVERLHATENSAEGEG